jgi:hypothetical protein
MPIDFSSIAATWLAAWQKQARRSERALLQLGLWLVERLQRLQRIDAATRLWPTYVFEGRALAVRITAPQVGIVKPYSSAGAAVAAPFLAFGRSFVRVGQAVEDELVLPNVLAAVQAAIGGIAESIDRWSKPSAKLFDPDRATASDLFGQLALAWRGLASSREQLRADAKSIVAGYEQLFPPRKPVAGALGPVAEPPSGSTGDSIGRYIVAAVTLLPVLPLWLGTLAQAAWLAARVALLDIFQGLEKRLFDLRAKVLRGLLVTLPRALREVPAMVAAMGTLLVWNIRYFTRLAQAWFDLIVFALDLVLRLVRLLVNTVIGVINVLLALMDKIFKTNLFELIKPLLGPAGFLVDQFGLKLTLDDILDVTGKAVNLAAWGTVRGALGTARVGVLAAGTHVPLVGRGIITDEDQAHYLRVIGLLEEVVDKFFGSTSGTGQETVKPVLADMPNLYDLMVGSKPTEIGQALRNWGGALAENFHSVLDTTASTLTRLAGVFDTTSADLARTGPAWSMAQLGKDTAVLVNTLYRDQLDALGKRLAETSPNSFERWLVQGGFETLGQAIPLYIEQMMQWWQAEAEREGAPSVHMNATSPHILAKHAVLARVHLARLVLRAPAREHDEGFVRELAQHVRGAVQQAYSEGRRRLAVLAATPV